MTLIEPGSNKNELNENIYELLLTHVASYQIDIIYEDYRTFEFDTDEVRLEKDGKSEGIYVLNFTNASVDIHIKFSGLAVKLLACSGKK